MPRTPNPEEVRRQLEQVLKSLRQDLYARPVYLPDGRQLAYDPSLLIRADGSLGTVARLMLIRCKVGGSAKQLQASYKSHCEDNGYQITNYTSLQYAFSLSTTQLKSLPPLPSLTRGMARILDQWRKHQGNNELGLPPHPESEQLFEKAFSGDDACERFLEYLEFSKPPAIQLAAGRQFNRSSHRSDCLETVTRHAVYGDSMLINVHAEVHWDGLRAFSESLAREIATAEARRAASLQNRSSHVQREVLFVPLRANASPAHRDSQYQIAEEYTDQHMGLDRLMGILSEFTRAGSAANLLHAPAMEDEVGFPDTLHKIRESLMMQARIIVFDGVFETEHAQARQSVERVIADDHFPFLLKRLMEPLLASTDDPHALDVFNQNRFIITSNSEYIGEKIWSRNRDSDGQNVRTPPITEPLRSTDFEDYNAMLRRSLPHADQVITLLRNPAFDHCRNDVVNQVLNSAVSLLAGCSAGPACESQSQSTDGKLDAAAETFVDYISKPSQGIADVTTVTEALMGWLSEHARLHAELLLMLSLAPEGLTLETIDRILLRLTMLPGDIEHPLPALHASRDAGCLDERVMEFTDLAQSIAGFIRKEFVEGPEVEDHPLECWEGLLADNDYRSRFQGLTLDFRYPEIRSSLQLSRYFERLCVDRFLIHRVISEIALQYQTTYFRHTDYRHRGSVRNWRRLITAIYHGLASIGHPDRDTHVQYGVRGAYIEGGTLDYWVYLYAKLYRQVMEDPGLWRISRVMGLDDLKNSLLELFSKPWLLHTHLIVDNGEGMPRFLDHYPSTPQPAAEFYLTRMRGALARGEVDGAYPGWYERFKSMNPQPSADIQLRMEYALLDTRLQTVESTSISDVIDVLQALTGNGEAFSNLELLVHDPDTDSGLVKALPIIGRDHHKKIPGLLSLVNMDDVTAQVQSTLESVANPGAVAMALNYYGTLSRFESDRADFSEGYHHVRQIPEGLNAAIREQLENLLTLNGPQRSLFRRRALARLLVVEAARIALFRMDPTGVGFTRSNAQGRTTVRLAIKLDDEYRQQLSLTQSVPSAYFRFARRMSDSCTRMTWQFPRDQSNALIMEASMLRSESKRITSSSQLTDADAELALRLLAAARATIGRSERVLTTPNMVSRARLRMMLERHKLNRDLAALHARCEDKENSRIYRQHAEYDLSMLRGAVDASDARPYWKLIVAYQRHLDS